MLSEAITSTSSNAKTLVVVEMLIDLVIYWLICKLDNSRITKKMM